MRAFVPLTFVCFLVAAVWACSSGSSSSSPGGPEGGAPDGGPFGDAQVIPQTESCADAGASCLSGTAAPKKFTAAPTEMEVRLYRAYPSGTAAPIQTQVVALDGTWAIPNVEPWDHYYVQLLANFSPQTPSIASVTGPITVPSKVPLALVVEPVQLQALEQSASTGFVLESAAARVFDPTSGNEIDPDAGVANDQTATVAIDVGGTSTPMPWTMEDKGVSVYLAQFSMPPAAQPTYTITTAGPAFGSSPASWQLVASPPTFTGMVTFPASGATLTAGQEVTVKWASQPAADYVLVELFLQDKAGQYTNVYASPQPDPADTLQETIPGTDVTSTGTYLLDVFFSTANCPATADGCVLASVVTAVSLTAQ